ncbi:MAG: hypothetical protein IT435_14790 [Phycisphaerales bacterium]|nr:hypothetical protein [Phycisphaerales bacterium]
MNDRTTGGPKTPASGTLLAMLAGAAICLPVAGPAMAEWNQPVAPAGRPAPAPARRPPPDPNAAGSVVRPPGSASPNQPAEAGAEPAVQPVTQPGEQPPQQPTDQLPPQPQPGAEPPLPVGDDVELSAFTEPVELTTLIDYVARALNINITVKGSLAGSVVFNAPVKVSKSRLLALLDALLEQQNYTITYDPDAQFYSVHPSAEVPIKLSDAEGATTRIFTTPNVRPSALKTAIDAQMGNPLSIPGQAPQPGQSRQYAYIDELGVIVATDSPRKLAQVESLILRLLAEYAKEEYIRMELTHIAAPVARERALQLVGQGSKSSAGQDINILIQQQQQGLAQGGGRTGFDNMGDRLTIDPQGNALIFRGLPEEIQQVKTVLAVIDVPSKLMPRSHEVGKAARPIAEIARQRGLGEVTQIADTRKQDPNNPYGFQGGGLTFQDPNQSNQQKQQSTTGGPVMVVDETRGIIVYYGTEEQQEALKALVDVLKTDDDRIVFRDYKLKNAKADDVAQIILGVLNNQTPAITPESSGDEEGGAGSGLSGYNRSSSLFGDSSGGNRRNTSTYRPTSSGISTGEEGLSIENAEDIFIVSDQAHNQLIVKAPIRDQESLARLITKLDLRRPQVYLEAKIVVVTWSDDLRLAFETQLINAGGTGGVLNTNFGITTGSGANVLTPKTVPGLAGLTAAIIKSDMVPIVMNALETEVDGRLLSTPQVLVDDNEPATIKSTDKQPTTTTTIGSGGNPNTTTFNDYVEAGTELKVTPAISDAGYIRLKYEINLSSFTGSGSNGIPPPILDNNLTANSVTVPSDATVVLGGLTFDSDSTTSEGVPILKDIPILGLLFQDLSKTKRKTTLYVFLTPRIMRDPNFADQRLLSAGPQAEVDLPSSIPELKPAFIDVFDTPLGDSSAPPTPAQPSSTPTSTSPANSPTPSPSPSILEPRQPR